MPIPDFWGGGGYQGKWFLCGQVPDDEDIWLGEQKVDLDELLRPPTDEERLDLRDYYADRESYRYNCVSRFGEQSRYTTDDIENLLELVLLHESRCDDCTPESEVTVMDFVRINDNVCHRWYIVSEYDRWRNDRAGWDGDSDYHRELHYDHLVDAA